MKAIPNTNVKYSSLIKECAKDTFNTFVENNMLIAGGSPFIITAQMHVRPK